MGAVAIPRGAALQREISCPSHGRRDTCTLPPPLPPIYYACDRPLGYLLLSSFARAAGTKAPLSQRLKKERYSKLYQTAVHCSY